MVFASMVFFDPVVLQVHRISEFFPDFTTLGKSLTASARHPQRSDLFMQWELLVYINVPQVCLGNRPKNFFWCNDQQLVSDESS